MKKITLLLIGSLFLVSCGKNQGEQMLHDYQQKNARALNFDIKDLDFKVLEIEKIGDITSVDSMKIIKREFAEYWTKSPEQSLVDTLSFDYVKGVLNQSISHQDTLSKLYQKSVLTAIEIRDYSYELDSKRKRDKALDEKFSFKETLSKIEDLELYHNALSVKPDSVLSTKYAATYSMNNPMLGNAKQTFDKVYYTNGEQSKFIKEEEAVRM